MRTEDADKINSKEDLQKHPELVVGAYENDALKEIIKTTCPENRMVMIDSYEDLPSHPEIDFVLWSLEKATAFAYLHPGFTVVVPNNIGSKLLFAFYMSYNNDALKEYINYWIDLQNSNGFIDQQKKYWFKGMTLMADQK